MFEEFDLPVSKATIERHALPAKAPRMQFWAQETGDPRFGGPWTALIVDGISLDLPPKRRREHQRNHREDGNADNEPADEPAASGGVAPGRRRSWRIARADRTAIANDHRSASAPNRRGF